MTSSSTLFSRPGLPRLDQSLATPLYHQLYTILKSMIVDGSLIFGEAITKIFFLFPTRFK